MKKYLRNSGWYYCRVSETREIVVEKSLQTLNSQEKITVQSERSTACRSIDIPWCERNGISTASYYKMLDKLGFIADYKGISVNSHILVLIRESIQAYEQEHGEIDGTINPAVNVKPSRKS